MRQPPPYVIITTTMVAATLIFSVTAYFLIRYRRRSETAVTPKVQGTLGWEVLFVGLPLTTFLVWFFVGYHDFIRMQTPPLDAMDVYVVGNQWMWKFTYPEGPNSIGVLRVPVGRPVRLLLTSRDVIHSFYVPSFRIKQDAIPGAYTQTWFQVVKPGTYRVMCAEYCGLKHSEMWGQVVALSQADYEAWMTRQRQGLVARRDATPSAPEELSPQVPVRRAATYVPHRVDDEAAGEGGRWLRAGDAVVPRAVGGSRGGGAARVNQATAQCSAARRRVQGACL